MQKSEIKVGEEYALREVLNRDNPFQPVKIIEYIRRNKWRAQWIDPNPGLMDYIESKHLIVR